MKTKLIKPTVLSNNHREKAIECPNCKGKTVYDKDLGIFLCENCPLATRLYTDKNGRIGV